MRIFFAYNGKPQKSFDTIFKTHGFRTLFINNLINKLADENGEIPEKKLVAILMGEFDYVFKGFSDETVDNKANTKANDKPKEELGEFKNLLEAAGDFDSDE